MTLFDRYIVVDWSARNSPATGPDSIWIADLDRRGVSTFSNPSTRRLAEQQLASAVETGTGVRTLLAVDASLGYPAGTATWCGVEGESPWRAMWATLEREVDDDARNRNNRFDVAASLNRRGGTPLFWGRPPALRLDALTVTKPPPHHAVDEFRACDRLLRSQGYRPASPWQLLGAGSVGSQTLTLVPILERIRRTYGAEIWPFTTGFAAPSLEPGGTVIAEVWPSAFRIPMPVHWVRDAAQVHGVARRLATADRHGRLAAWFAPTVDDPETAAEEEGWILGAGVSDDPDAPGSAAMT